MAKVLQLSWYAQRICLLSKSELNIVKNKAI